MKWSIVEKYLRKINFILEDLDSCIIKHHFLCHLKKKKPPRLILFIFCFPFDSLISASPSIERWNNKKWNRIVRKAEEEPAVYPVQCLTQIVVSAVIQLLPLVEKQSLGMRFCNWRSWYKWLSLFILVPTFVCKPCTLYVLSVCFTRVSLKTFSLRNHTRPTIILRKIGFLFKNCHTFLVHA